MRILLRSTLVWLLTIFLLPAGPSVFAAGVVEGVVLLPPSKRGSASALRYSAIKGLKPAPASRSVVWIEGDFETAKEKRETMSLAQIGFQFQHSILAIQVGTKVTFPNKDDDYHSVFSYSKTKEFDLGRYRNSEDAPSIVFDKAGEVKIYCEIHEHMRATVLVVDTPFFTTTDEKGKFRLEGLPPGSHVLKYKVGRKTYEQPIEVKDEGVLQLKLGK
ncbi:hypothetical protein N9B94_01250 [Verrucomicrobia bacterium]|nr:hypothetical protein [Verrucomicrobiota bacterium]